MNRRDVLMAYQENYAGFMDANDDECGLDYSVEI